MEGYHRPNRSLLREATLSRPRPEQVRQDAKQHAGRYSINHMHYGRSTAVTKSARYTRSQIGVDRTNTNTAAVVTDRRLQTRYKRSWRCYCDRLRRLERKCRWSRCECKRRWLQERRRQLRGFRQSSNALLLQLLLLREQVLLLLCVLLLQTLLRRELVAIVVLEHSKDVAALVRWLHRLHAARLCIWTRRWRVFRCLLHAYKSALEAHSRSL